MIKLLPLIALFGAPALAADRTYTVTDFDRIRVEGPFIVTIATGTGATARAEGETTALDALSLRVDGRTLVVRASRSGWGGWPGEVPAIPTIRLTAPTLRAVIVNGGGQVTVDRMEAARIDLTLTGTGSITTPGIETDRLVASLTGSGRFVLGGTALTASVVTRGAGDVDAAALVVRDLAVNAESAGEARFTAQSSVRVVSTGAGAVSVAGDAACTVQSTGVGPVACRR